MIDTAEKRKAISGIHLYAAGPGVTPNALADQEWRQESGYSYPGIAAGGAAPTYAGAADEARSFCYPGPSSAAGIIWQWFQGMRRLAWSGQN